MTDQLAELQRNLIQVKRRQGCFLWFLILIFFGWIGFLLIGMIRLLYLLCKWSIKGLILLGKTIAKLFSRKKQTPIPPPSNQT